MLEEAREGSTTVTNETPEEITAKAQVVIDSLTADLKREKEAMKGGLITGVEYGKFHNKVQTMINNTIKERDKKLKFLVIKTDPKMEAITDARMKADHERRRYEKFMKEAGPALESALSLEEAD